ncbi:hypothetical protein PHLGIDRAFT_147296 [Phlebiopsis gigantea 11061_1 CR5-6]|uniref:P-loop containing nucleoside triphosphate hydrolase protein n=1 Tax=Phlebiopsis gigantea (strain 11061_1 CR5-6) TaxID=745531 RepID=A0A0C3NKR3_PHLG1|nr:hypothetical protein PHLGIDRAFT_147296 [Phlebiopsis gigantea 11061_1 CR5-6]
MSRAPCRFHNIPGGCRNGTGCRFAHVESESSSLSGVDAYTTKPSVRNENRDAPQGVCRFFWKYGNCRHGFTCRHRHEHGAMQDVETTNSSSSSQSPHTTSLRSEQPFTSRTQPKSPFEVHNYLKRYLQDGYQFRNALDMHSFVALLLEATANNAGWTKEEGQLLLSAIGKGNGLQRINELLSCDEVSTRPMNRTVLSFHRGYIPLLQYLSSDFVIKSVLSHLRNALYMVLMEHFDLFCRHLRSCMEGIMTGTRCFKEPAMLLSTGRQDVGGVQVFDTLATVLLECLIRMKNVTVAQPEMRPLVVQLNTWFESWVDGVTSDPPIFNDPLTSSPLSAREQVIHRLEKKYEQLVTIVNREHARTERSNAPPQKMIKDVTNEGTISALHNSYVGPGQLRSDGPRHDNDHVEISDIRIAPTHEELICRVAPFLPSTLHGAPHPYPPESPERLLDIWYRLLREELTSSLRQSVQHILDDLSSSDSRTQLTEVLEKQGGKYRGQTESDDAVLFNVYTGVRFEDIIPNHRGLSSVFSLDTPPGRARSDDDGVRTRFWQGMSGKRLISGGLVALIWQRGSEVDVHLGTITSSVRDHVASAQEDATRITARVAFFDSDVQLRLLQNWGRNDGDDLMLLIEATVMFASVRPFLEALCVEPTKLPFTRYLVLQPPGTLQHLPIHPPAYARAPDFAFQLASLFLPDAGVASFELVATNAESIAAARRELRDRSTLDPSQADALVDSLTREYALIQGPPGTGKSYTGVKIIQTLIASGAFPILMIAFTNHALDHMLCSVLDAGITKRIVRLGSRSSEERLSSFTIEHLEQLAGESRLERAFIDRNRVNELKVMIKDFMNESVQGDIAENDVLAHLNQVLPVYSNDIDQPPTWIQQLYYDHKARSAEWTRVGNRSQGRQEKVTSIYSYWLHAYDIDVLEQAARPRVEASSTIALQANARTLPPAAVSILPNMYEVLAPPNDDLGDEREDGSNAEHDLEHDLATSYATDDLPDEKDDIPLEEQWVYHLEDTTADDSTVTEENRGPNSSPIPSATATSKLPADISPKHVPRSFPSRHTSTNDIDDVDDFFHSCGYDRAPKVPLSDRSLDLLLDHDDIWTLSRTERQRLHEYLMQDVESLAKRNRSSEFERLRGLYAKALEEHDEGKAAGRCELLRDVDIIGCTTTGAANLTAMLEVIGPRVMLVEEAGQVLEPHILGALVPSVQHVIQIGDPLQLRPTINNYSLSSEHRRGGQIWRFDQSQMERLSRSGFPMAQLDEQRRMRPQIADLVRTTLYPNLKDHEMVTHYPAVRGMHKPVYFLDHRHKENGSEDDSISRHNQFEVDLTVDLVLYLLRQGPYCADGDIVVLCAYLGQLARMRDAMAHQVTVVIDERDQRELDDRGGEQKDSEEADTGAKRVEVTQRVRLRTIDNYQGEEAKIVILSLVRNSGGASEEAVHGHSSTAQANVGFLKSENRTNVALSRAREGMYVLGNARDLRTRSSMWGKVLSRLEQDDCVGPALPVVCHRHQEVIEWISKPGQLGRVAPDGGCLQQCDSMLSCGHLCPYKCHSDDPAHVTVRCEQNCAKLCSRGHPCMKSCADPCGHCPIPTPHIELPCGHVKARVSCGDLDDLSQVRCNVVIRKQLPNCEHVIEMACSDDPKSRSCTAICNGILPCCGRTCQAECHRCRIPNPLPNTEGDNAVTPVVITVHHTHSCQRRLYCEHPCANPCSDEHDCTVECMHPCRQACAHAQCKRPCSAPCAPCLAPCIWRCAHYECPVPCGSVCARLPCNARCPTILPCGHQCPSVCGEDCSIQVCPSCALDELKAVTVDLILYRTLGDIDPDMEDLDNLLITLPGCGHTFTVETLDGHTSLHEFYSQDHDGRWIGLLTPDDSELRKPPTCPTCRTSIKTNRYGRVYKRAYLDILEHNVASRMSRSLSTISRQLEDIQPEQMKKSLLWAARSRKLVMTRTHRSSNVHANQQKTVLRQGRSVPIPDTALRPGNTQLFNISALEVQAWDEVTRSLVKVYSDTVAVATMRSAHVRAWEASFSYLFQQEMERARREPGTASRGPHELYAMRIARLGVGQPQPRADRRFIVEAFWLSIRIRLVLANLAQSWVSALSKSYRSWPKENKRQWSIFISFLYRSCRDDCNRALKITTETESHRQTVRTRLLVMRVQLESFRFNLETTRDVGQFQKVRDKLVERAEQQRGAVEQDSTQIQSAHLSIPRSNTTEEEIWLSTNFAGTVRKFIDEWEKIGRSVRGDSFFEPLSLQEMEGIVKSLNFSHTGHFYKCPNGHTFVISDCGGANQRSFCPECGSPIGGSNHVLTEGNTRAMEYERIAQEQGAQQSPFRWGELTR